LVKDLWTFSIQEISPVLFFFLKIGLRVSELQDPENGISH